MHGIRSFHTAKRAVLVAGVVLFVGLAGCGDSTKSSISGKVTYKSAAVTGGTITLVPASMGGNSFVIDIGADGAFSTGDVAPGQYKVSVSTDNVAAPVAPPAGAKDYPMPGTGTQAKKVVIPDKFKNADTSGITWTVKSGKQVIPIDLDK
jgi:hypothetical protein